MRPFSTLASLAAGVAALFAPLGVGHAQGWTGNERVLLETAKLTVSSAFRVFGVGASVAVSGDTVALGAPGYFLSRGAAYVFVRAGAGWTNMSERALLTASDPRVRSFGSSLAASGTTIFCGAPKGFVPPSTGLQGAVYVFERSPGGWVDTTETAKLTASDGFRDNLFGESIAVHGDTLVVGASKAGSKGAIYVFEKPPGGWVDATETAKLTASDVGGGLGKVVGVSGTTIAGSATRLPAQQFVYVFEKPSGGWVDATETAKLRASNVAVGVKFGDDLALSDTTLVASTDRLGAAYVFERPPSGWVSGIETARLTPSLGGIRVSSLGVVGDTVLVGRVQAGVRCGSEGSVYFFDKPANGWQNMSETGRLVATDGLTGDSFGVSLDRDGATIVVSALASGSPNWGAAYVFDSPYNQGPRPTPALTSISKAQLVNRLLPERRIRLDGSGLQCVSQLTVGGRPRTIVGQQRTWLEFNLPRGFPVGMHEVVATGPSGASEPLVLDVQGSHPSVLVAPLQHAVGATHSYNVWTDAGWQVLYLASMTPGPTALPGVVSLDIGGGSLGNISCMAVLTATAAGVTSLPVTMPNAVVPPFNLRWECLTYDPAVPLVLQAPLETSSHAPVLTLQ